MKPPSTPQQKRGDAVGIRDLTDASLRTPRKTSGPLVRRVINGRYQVVDTLGAGSLGTVYLCDDIPTATRVAVKVFRREFAKDDEFMDRLRRQAKRARMLSEKTSSVLEVYDCDRTEDGGAFIATEYLQGRTLKDVIRRGARWRFSGPCAWPARSPADWTPFTATASSTRMSGPNT